MTPGLRTASDLGVTVTSQEYPLKGDIGVQFGRVYYTVNMTFEQVRRFLRAFGEVQRGVNQSHVSDLKKYFRAYLSLERDFGIIPAMAVNARGPIRYDAEKREVVLGYETVLSVNDGQHRWEAISQLLGELEDQIKNLEEGLPIKRKKLSEEDRAAMLAEVREQYDALRTMTVTLNIADNVSEVEEQQAFADLNAKAKKANKSIVLQYDHTDLYAKLAHTLIESIPLDDDVVASDTDKLDDNSRQLISFSTMRSTIKELLGPRFKLSRHTMEKAQEIATIFFCAMLQELPEDASNRKKYIIGNSLVWQAAGRFARNVYADPMNNFMETVANLGRMDWTHPYWRSLGFAWDSEKDRVIFKGSGAIPAIVKAMEERVAKIPTISLFDMSTTDASPAKKDMEAMFEEEIASASAPSPVVESTDEAEFIPDASGSEETVESTTGFSETASTAETQELEEEDPFAVDDEDVPFPSDSGDSDLPAYDEITQAVYRMAVANPVLSQQEIADQINHDFEGAGMTRNKVRHALDRLKRDGLLA